MQLIILTDFLPGQTLEKQLHITVQGYPEYQTDEVVGEV